MFDLYIKKINQQHTSQNLAALFSKYLWCLAMRKSFLNLCLSGIIPFTTSMGEHP